MNRPELTFTLPTPPSANNLFINVGRKRVKSKRYRAWQKAAGWELVAQRQGCLGGPWEVDIALPADLRGDVDNRVKPILDLLVTHGVVDDDKHCQRVTVARAVTVGPVIVILRAAVAGPET